MTTQLQYRTKDCPGKHDGLAKKAYAAYVTHTAPDDVPVKQYEQWYAEDWLPLHGGTADLPE